MSSIDAITSVLGLSFVSGINLYATVLVVGVAQRVGWLTSLPDEMRVLGHPVVLGVAGLLYLIEFFADKIPFVTPIWDAIHTFIRPLGAAALALGAASDMSPAMQTAAALIGGGIGLGAHSSKMGVRLLAHSSPEPVTHSAISVAEDVGVAGLLLLVYTYPWIALGVLIALIVGMILLAPVLIRTARFLMSGIGGRLRAWFGGCEPPAHVPQWVQERADLRGADIARVYARSLRGVSKMKAGLLVRAQGRQWLAFHSRFRKQMIEIEGMPEFRRGVLFDVACVEAGGRRGSIYFTKDCSRKLGLKAVRPAPTAA